MENNIFLDKVVEFLVRDTMTDHDKDKIQFPFYLFSSYSSYLLVSVSSPLDGW